MEFIYPNSPIDLEMDDRREAILSHTKPFVLPDWWHTTKVRQRLRIYPDKLRLIESLLTSVVMGHDLNSAERRRLSEFAWEFESVARLPDTTNADIIMSAYMHYSEEFMILAQEVERLDIERELVRSRNRQKIATKVAKTLRLRVEREASIASKPAKTKRPAAEVDAFRSKSSVSRLSRIIVETTTLEEESGYDY